MVLLERRERIVKVRTERREGQSNRCWDWAQQEEKGGGPG